MNVFEAVRRAMRPKSVERTMMSDRKGTIYHQGQIVHVKPGDVVRLGPDGIVWIDVLMTTTST